jgi:predicted transcriptional regulator
VSGQSQGDIEQSAPNVILSIDPEWADAILSGSKTWEYRKVAPSRGPPMRLVLYASAPVKAAIGVAWSYTVLEKPVPVLIEETVQFTPHDRDDVLDYFDDTETGYAIRIGTYRPFDEPVPRADLEAEGLSPSQNFRYIGEVEPNERAVEPQLVIADGDRNVRSLDTEIDREEETT